jgi:hypothetical protein
MDDPNYKLLETHVKINDYVQINEYLETIRKEHHHVTAWQTLPNGNREICTVFVEKMNPGSPEFKLTPVLENDDLARFRKNIPLYLHANFKKLVAQVQIVYSSKSHLFVASPTEVHVLEQKKIPRIRVNNQEHRLSFLMSKKSYTMPIADVSNTGAAIVISKNQVKHFSYSGGKILITQVFSTKLQKPLEANVIYIRSLGEKGFRVGIKFKNAIEIDKHLPAEL